MWRRVLRVPFAQTIAKADRNPKVKATLCNPAKAGPAILAWAVRGCLEWQRRGLAVPDVVRVATDAYRADQDPISEFIEDACRLDANTWTPTRALRNSYQRWCKANEVEAIGDRAFTQLLKSRGCEAKARSGIRGWRGIELAKIETLSAGQ